MDSKTEKILEQIIYMRKHRKNISNDKLDLSSMKIQGIVDFKEFDNI